MVKTYQCMCLKCYGASKLKYITKRTVEAHIWQDWEIPQSTSTSNTDLVDFFKLRIYETLQVLSGVCVGPDFPDTESDLDGSRPAGSEGACSGYAIMLQLEKPKEDVSRLAKWSNPSSVETSHAQLVSHSGEYLSVCPLFKGQRKFTECTRGRRQEDKLDSKSEYPRVYIHTRWAIY